MNIEHIKRLRSETNKSMLEIKEALLKSNDDYEQAKAYLMSSFKENTSERVASKGSIEVAIDEDQAVIFELIAETDFVQKNPIYIELVETLKKALLTLPDDDMGNLDKFTIDKHTISEYIKIKASQIHESIYLRRYEKIKKKPNQAFSTYVHHDKKSASLLLLNVDNQVLKETLAKQVVAMDAAFISQAHLLDEDIKVLRSRYDEQPFDYQSFDGYLAAKSLYDQSFIAQPDIKVKDLLDQTNAQVLILKRYALGEGIKDKLICRVNVPSDIKTIHLKR